MRDVKAARLGRLRGGVVVAARRRARLKRAATCLRTIPDDAFSIWSRVARELVLHYPDRLRGGRDLRGNAPLQRSAGADAGRPVRPRRRYRREIARRLCRLALGISAWHPPAGDVFFLRHATALEAPSRSRRSARASRSRLFSQLAGPIGCVAVSVARQTTGAALTWTSSFEATETQTYLWLLRPRSSANLRPYRRAEAPVSRAAAVSKKLARTAPERESTPKA